MKLASHLRIPLQKLKRETTASELILWKVFLEEEWNTPRREDYYAAQIAQEVRRVLAKNPSRVKLDSFLLKFGGPQVEQETSQEFRLQQSKNFWLGMVGISNARSSGD